MGKFGGVWKTIPFMYPHRKKLFGFRTGELEGFGALESFDALENLERSAMVQILPKNILE